MEPKEIICLTDVETIKKQYYEILKERVHTDATHPLYVKGVFDGMEIITKALSQSITERKKLEGQIG